MIQGKNGHVHNVYVDRTLDPFPVSRLYTAFLSLNLLPFFFLFVVSIWPETTERVLTFLLALIGFIFVLSYLIFTVNPLRYNLLKVKRLTRDCSLCVIAQSVCFCGVVFPRSIPIDVALVKVAWLGLPTSIGVFANLPRFARARSRAHTHHHMPLTCCNA